MKKKIIIALIFVSALIITMKPEKKTPAAQEEPKKQTAIVIVEIEEPEVKEEIEEEIEEPEYDEKELELLAHLINAEAGATYCSEKMRYYVGSVALNRVKSEDFPDTLEEVIYQEGQYACIEDGNFDKEPSEECWDIAKELLKYGPVLPENVVFQAEFEQGDGVYCKEQNMIFCYKEKEEE